VLNPSFLTKVSLFFRLVRWKNLLIVDLVLFSIYQFGSSWNGGEFDLPFYMYLCAVMLVMAGGNVINDYYDYKIDVVNKPSSLVVTNGISRRSCLIIYASLNVAALLFIDSLLFVLYGLGTISLLWLYSYKLKAVPLMGNIVVAALTFYSIYLLSFFIDTDYPVRQFALLAAFIQLLREIVKDLEDVKGDKEHGCLTFPVVFGQLKTKVLIYFIAGIFLGIMLLWQWHLDKHVWSLYAVYYLLIVFIVKVYRASHKSHFTFLSGLLKMMMLVGLSSVIFV
jgi:4-hydroxybenzoate polyprenyltransferase